MRSIKRKVITHLLIVPAAVHVQNRLHAVQVRLHFAHILSGEGEVEDGELWWRMKCERLLDGTQRIRISVEFRVSPSLH